MDQLGVGVDWECRTGAPPPPPVPRDMPVLSNVCVPLFDITAARPAAGPARVRGAPPAAGALARRLPGRGAGA